MLFMMLISGYCVVGPNGLTLMYSGQFVFSPLCYMGVIRPSVQWVGLSGRVSAVMYKVPDPCRR